MIFFWSEEVSVPFNMSLSRPKQRPPQEHFGYTLLTRTFPPSNQVSPHSPTAFPFIFFFFFYCWGPFVFLFPYLYLSLTAADFWATLQLSLCRVHEGPSALQNPKQHHLLLLSNLFFYPLSHKVKSWDFLYPFSSFSSLQTYFCATFYCFAELCPGAPGT